MPTMAPEQWKESLGQVRDRISRFLERMRPHKDNGSTPEHMAVDVVPAFMQTGGPLLDMHESGTDLVVSVEVPGLGKDDISVELVGKCLIIRGEKQITREQKLGGSLLTESRYGSFARRLQLPCDVDDRSIRADLKHGLLTIRLPRPEPDRNRRQRVPVS